MDPKAFFKLNYGVYIVSSSADGQDGGCVINTMAQVTSSPARLSIALNKTNYTLKLIETSGTFSGVVLSEDVEMEQIKRFGFQSGKNVDKYDGIPQGRDSLSNPYPTDVYKRQILSSPEICGRLYQRGAGGHLPFLGSG